MRRGTRKLIVTVASVLLVFAPSLAWAAIWLEVHPDTAPPGTEVQVQLLGGAAHQAGEQMPLFLVPGDATTRYYQPNTKTEDVRSDPGVVALDGLLIKDEAGHAATTFTVPDVPPGHYVIFFQCLSCATYSFGRDFAAGADFQVVAPETLPQTGQHVWFIGLIAVLVLVAGIALTRKTRLPKALR